VNCYTYRRVATNDNNFCLPLCGFANVKQVRNLITHLKSHRWLNTRYFCTPCQRANVLTAKLTRRIANHDKSPLPLTATRCLTPTVLYTDVDGQCDKLVTDDRHQFTTLTAHLRWQDLRRSAVPEVWLVAWCPPKFKRFTWPNHTQWRNFGLKSGGPSSRRTYKVGRGPSLYFK